MEQAVGALDVADLRQTSDALLAALAQDPPDEDPLDSLVRRVLLAMLDERRTRQPDSAGERSKEVLSRRFHEPRGRDRKFSESDSDGVEDSVRHRRGYPGRAELADPFGP
jgi:hypothetical protein